MAEATYAIVWVTDAIPVSPALGDGARWLMVKHIERGWELPGGNIAETESADEAALRELREETGLGGSILSWRMMDDGGTMFWLVAERSGETSWDSEDPAIEEVGWFLQPPLPLAWGIDELVTAAAWAHSSSKIGV